MRTKIELFKNRYFENVSWSPLVCNELKKLLIFFARAKMHVEKIDNSFAESLVHVCIKNSVLKFHKMCVAYNIIEFVRKFYVFCVQNPHQRSCTEKFDCKLGRRGGNGQTLGEKLHARMRAMFQATRFPFSLSFPRCVSVFVPLLLFLFPSFLLILFSRQFRNARRFPGEK